MILNKPKNKNKMKRLIFLLSILISATTFAQTILTGSGDIILESNKEYVIDGNYEGQLRLDNLENVTINGINNATLFDDNIPIYIVNGGKNITIKDLDIFSTLGAAEIVRLYGNPENVTIQNCTLRDGSFGIRGGAINLKVLNTDIYNHTNDGAYLASGRGFLFDGVHIHSVNLKYLTAGFESGGDCIQLEATSTNKLYDLTILNSVFDRRGTGHKFAIIANWTDNILIKNSIIYAPDQEPERGKNSGMYLLSVNNCVIDSVKVYSPGAIYGIITSRAVITNSIFIDAYDVAVQMNDNGRVENSYFVNCNVGVSGWNGTNRDVFNNKFMLANSSQKAMVTSWTTYKGNVANMRGSESKEVQSNVTIVDNIVVPDDIPTFSENTVDPPVVVEPEPPVVEIDTVYIYDTIYVIDTVYLGTQDFNLVQEKYYLQIDGTIDSATGSVNYANAVEKAVNYKLKNPNSSVNIIGGKTRIE